MRVVHIWAGIVLFVLHGPMLVMIAGEGLAHAGHGRRDFTMLQFAQWLVLSAHVILVP